MNLYDVVNEIKQEYEVLCVLNLDQLPSDYFEFYDALKKQFMTLYKSEYHINQRLIFTYTKDDYNKDEACGLKLQALQQIANDVDISNFFICVITTNQNVEDEYKIVFGKNIDQVPFNLFKCTGDFIRQTKNKSVNNYVYGSPVPWKISVDELNDLEKQWLMKSKTFCMYPWIHMHVYPEGDTMPCCLAENKGTGPIGSVKQNTLKELWNSKKLKNLRNDMLCGKPNEYCTRCYEQENSGFFSGRQSANKHHGHLVKRVHETQPDGTFERFEMVYWDIRFSNLCNLRCRSCGHSFSSSWYKDQVALAGPEWAKQNKPLLIAGRDPDDMYMQLMEHIDYVEQIYFAGGEPLMMEEHYLILEELERRERFDVRLIYNTNFTNVKLKDRSVFDYWKRFDSVAVGASLDAMGPHAEYIRKGTKWEEVEQNRRDMLEICPNVDFYISPTLSIMNALHLPDFHQDWVNKGLLEAQDLNINCLFDPPHYRIQVAGERGKNLIKEKYLQHLEWLRPLDKLQRATVGFESAINFVDAQDRKDLQAEFWDRTNRLDQIRNEKILDIIPELTELLQ